MKDIIILVKGKHDAILLKDIDCKYEVIVAYGYDPLTNSWDQGHYFTTWNKTTDEKIQVLQSALDFWKVNNYK